MNRQRPPRNRNSRRRRRSIIALIAAAVLVTAAVFAFGAIRGNGQPGSDGGRASAPGTNATPLYTVERRTISNIVPASGELIPSETVIVRPSTNTPSRTITAIHVREGDRVHAGDILIEVDTRGLELELSGARASFDAARIRYEDLQRGPDASEIAASEASLSAARLRRDQQLTALERTRQLVERDLATASQLREAENDARIAEADYEVRLREHERLLAGTPTEQLRSQQASLASAENALRRAELALEEATVRSPAGGVIAEVHVVRGDVTGTNTELVTIVESNPMIFRAGVDENDIDSLAVGNQVQVRPFGLQGAVFAGEVVRIGQRARSQGNLTVFEVDVAVANPQGRLRWGMSADADIVTGFAEDALVVPVAAVSRAGRASAVTIQTTAGAERREITLGLASGTLVEVVSGLEEGEQIVVPEGFLPAAGGFSAEDIQQRIQQARQGGGGAAGAVPGGILPSGAIPRNFR